MMEMRRCTKCGEEKPATREYFNVDKSRSDGFKSHCKECIKRHYQENADRINERQRRYYQENAERIIEGQLRYQQENAEKIRARKKNYQQANAEKRKASARNHYQANRARILERMRFHYRANAEKILARHSRYQQENRELRRVHHQNRRARRKRAPGSFTPQDVQHQYNMQRGCCYWCGAAVEDNYHVDHVIPLSRGGTNYPDNIVIACPTCNTSRGAKLPEEWNGPYTVIS